MPVAKANDGKHDETGVQDCGEPQVLVDVFADVEEIDDDPEPPVGDVFARLPPTADEAEAGEGGVKIGQRCVELLRKFAEHKAAGNACNESN